jgi:hypothetical protein
VLPDHERLIKSGITFVNHRINSCVCTPSRSVFYTGQHIQHTKMFDNTNFPWIKSMSTDIRTVGDMMREAGYYSTYKGKRHLNKEFETVNKLGTPTKIFTQEMMENGFSDYFCIGDIIAHHQGGYLHDGVIAAMSVSWLRGKGRELAAEGNPWFLAVNLVNPHDVMFYDTDLPGQPFQAPKALTHVVREPNDPLDARQWTFTLPANHEQALHAPGRPPAHYDFLRSHDALVGEIPDEEPRWRRRHNYNMFAYLDGDFVYKAVAYLKQGGDPKQLQQAGIVPNLMKVGAIRMVYDGQYVFARYFSPKQHNRPTTVEELYRFNDVELFDTAGDPLEMNNLAAGENRHKELVLAMNEKLNRLIDAEVGEDRGQMLPGGIEAGWEVTPETMEL